MGDWPGTQSYKFSKDTDNLPTCQHKRTAEKCLDQSHVCEGATPPHLSG